MKKIPNNSITVYLIKEEYDNNEDILNEDLDKITIGNDQVVYYKDSYESTPTWVETFFKNNLELKDKLSNSSSRSIVLNRVNIANDDSSKIRIFAIPFGYGKYLLKDDVIEERFGIKLAVNLIGEKNLRSINKTNLSFNNKMSKEQMPKASTIHEFEFNINGDLINGITGKSMDESLVIGNVTGTDAFKVSIPYNIENINVFLKKIYALYLKDDYKKSFGWIDHIKPIKNIETVNSLDNLLFESIMSSNNDFYMAIPEVLNFEMISGFKIPGIEEIQKDIELQRVIDSFTNKLENIKQFKDKRITVIDSLNGEVYSSFSTYTCFIGEVDYQDRSYTISNGKWYEIKKDFVEEINNTYKGIELSNLDLIDAKIDIWEKEYNKTVLESNPNYYFLLDSFDVSYGGGNSKIEVCDLLTKDNKLIHIKKYGGSNVLSHLFNQGVVSARLIKSDKKFIDKANEKITSENHKISQDKDYEVVYGIISKYEDERPKIPFFSRVSIDNAVKQLRSMNYRVSIKRIKLK